ncbi:MAG: hypothetical protein AABZ61_06500 [Bacteroidota bacterium]
MNITLTHILRWPVLAGLVMYTLSSCICIAQDSKNFATKGTTEVGGNISFQSLTPVFNGNTGDAVTLFTMAPFIGYFVSDGFEIGVNPLGVSVFSISGSSSTSFRIFVAPSYNFKTEGIVYPFIEALLGYTTESNGASRSGFSWGGRAGVKLAVMGNGLLNLGVQYLQITLNPSGTSNRYGSNELNVSAGFTVWFK